MSIIPRSHLQFLHVPFTFRVHPALHRLDAPRGPDASATPGPSRRLGWPPRTPEPSHAPAPSAPGKEAGPGSAGKPGRRGMGVDVLKTDTKHILSYLHVLDESSSIYLEG